MVCPFLTWFFLFLDTSSRRILFTLCLHQNRLPTSPLPSTPSFSYTFKTKPTSFPSPSPLSKAFSNHSLLSSLLPPLSHISMKGRRNHHLSPVGSPSSDTECGGAIAAVGHGLDSSPKEQDRFLPIANVSRIMKRSLPANAKISKEAKETVQECVSEFISFITGEASDKCQREKRKTINGDDLLWAMTTLGFENYIEPLKVYLNKYREIEGEKNSMARQGEQSSNEEGNHNPSSNHGASGAGPMANSNIVTSNASLMGFAGGFYSAVAPQGFEGGGRMMGFGEHSKMSDFDMGRVNEGGDGNGGRVLPSHLHGVQWR